MGPRIGHRERGGTEGQSRDKDVLARFHAQCLETQMDRGRTRGKGDGVRDRSERADFRLEAIDLWAEWCHPAAANGCYRCLDFEFTHAGRRQIHPWTGCTHGRDRPPFDAATR